MDTWKQRSEQNLGLEPEARGSGRTGASPGLCPWTGGEWPIRESAEAEPVYVMTVCGW